MVGQYDVSKVVISSECCDRNDKSRMWVDKTKSELSDQSCGILGCRNRAKVGCLVLVETLPNILNFVLPVCLQHSRDPDFEYPLFKPTKKDASLVRETTDSKINLY